MDGSVYFWIVIGIYVGHFGLHLVTEVLNVSKISPDLPTEFDSYFDTEKYKTSQQYLKENTRLSLFEASLSMVVLLPFIVLGGFNWVDLWVRQFDVGPIVTGLIFFGVLGFLGRLMSLPFTVYHTFGIEKKYGFNKTTIKTFVLDRVKGFILLLILGVPVASLILWFFGRGDDLAWVWCWLFLTAFQLVMSIIAPVLIMPIFNKFDSLEDGELRQGIESYAKGQDFDLSGVFRMDGSKRSTKSNAFFTGIGRFRRIVLFDTLIENHTAGEVVAVIAHEMGHYKKKHIYKSMFMSFLSSGFMLFVLSLFIENPGLFAAFKMETLSVYASFVFFSFLYTPIDLVTGVASNIFSRKHEFEADEYAVTTGNDSTDMVNALKKLSVDNLSNLKPHPLKVFLEYSHPPVLKRIHAIESLSSK